ncbi:MAG: DNA-3-methyladenine glycosylase [Acidobacteria bacterium]|nr:DNA-3-methyladenine glycosylase [Acidobacteriota bacterium]MCA1651799.1 DNA-3-methyladenine glycosylase [Acidobacteriota bacterium]
MTPADYARARRLLLRRDPILAALIKRHGQCGLASAQRADHFSALVRAITGQQLSVKAAATIYGRMVALMPEAQPTPATLATVPDEQLRAAGMSRQKVQYLRDLSDKVLTGALPLDDLDAMSDEEVIAALTQVKGIGRWSAEMFLMFRLHRPDVLPVDDLGIVNAVHRVYRLRKRPTADRIRQIGEAWKPYRSVASWYLWRSLDNEPSR